MVVTVIILNQVAIFYDIAISLEKKSRKDSYIKKWKEFISYKNMLVTNLIEI